MNTKKFLLPVILLTLFFAETKSAEKNLKAILTYKSFYNSQTGPYIETYLAVTGSTVVFAEKGNGKYQASIEVMIKMLQDGMIKYADKYNLLSPESVGPDKIDFNFLDQQRIPLANGKYFFELSVKDNHNTGAKPFVSTQEISIEYYPNQVTLSDIELVEDFRKIDESKSNAAVKNGFEIIPYADNYYGPEAGSLKFYAEIYNTSRVAGYETFLVSYHIQTYEKKRILEAFRGFSKKESAEVTALLAEMPIDKLPSGNYTLMVEVRNRKNEIIAFKECFFQRNNPMAIAEMQEGNIRSIDVSNTFVASMTNKDTLADYISSLQPISNAAETMFENNQLKIADVKLMQQFLYDFWARHNPTDPEAAWLEYHREVLKVNSEFGTLTKRGYETDRGRVYLQHGPPNKMIREYHEPSAYPYEIWHYYKLESQSNRKFVFYNPDLVTNDFALIHSNATGEIYDNQWQLKLHKRDTQINDYDRSFEINDKNIFGNKINREYGDH